MAFPVELLREARKRREEAARVRRLAWGLSINAVQARLLKQADDIETEARDLERQAVAGDPAKPAAASSAPVQQQQVQQQQQHKAEPGEQKPSRPNS